MMKHLTATIAAMLALSLPAFAEGDAAKGEKAFKKCKSCHMIKSEDETFVKGGKTGPNLFGVIGRTAGTVEGFKYGNDLVAAGEAGLVWDEEQLAEFIKDPKKYLKAYLDDSGAKSKMSLKLKKGSEDVASYLAGFSDAAPMDDAGDDAAATD